MSSPTMFISIVEPDHTVKAPSNMTIGTKVIVMPMPSIVELLEDTGRRARFAATHQAVREAIRAHANTPPLTDETILNLVHQARQTIHNH